MTPSTAILLFSRSAAAEAQSKGFGAGTRGDVRVAKRLIARTEATLARSGLPVFRSDEATQVGTTFGERLANAMAAVYDRGYDRLLVVGNDCPSVRPGHLRAAARLLAAGTNVLGPDHRGGIWLLGLRRADFCPARLAGLSWQSATLHADLVAALPGLASVRRLADVNALADLRRHWRRLRAVLGGLGDLIRDLAAAFAAPPVAISAPAARRAAGRGPPRS